MGFGKVKNINGLILGKVNVRSCSQYMNGNNFPKKGTNAKRLVLEKHNASNGIIQN